MDGAGMRQARYSQGRRCALGGRHPGGKCKWRPLAPVAPLGWPDVAKIFEAYGLGLGLGRGRRFWAQTVTCRVPATDLDGCLACTLRRGDPRDVS